MPDWFAITGAIANAATAVDLACRYSPPEVIHGKDAGKMLQEVDYILKHSNSVLENHKDIMDGDTYEEFKDKYRVFHWQMADESQGHRAIRDQIIRQSRILSELYASEESRGTRAKKLLADVEQYQTDVLSASQAAHQVKRGKPLAMFPDIKNPPKSLELTPTSSSFTSWLSKRSATPSDIESVGSSEAPSLSRSSTATGSSNTSIDEEEKYIVAITHIPAEDTDINPGSAPPAGLYHRVISYKSEGELVAVMERETRMLNEDEAHVDEDTLRSMFLSGKKHLSSRRMQGASLTDNAPGLSLESTVEEFKQMSTN